MSNALAYGETTALAGICGSATSGHGHASGGERQVHAGLRRFVQDLNRTYGSEPVLHELDFDPAGFQWVDCNDNDNSVVSFIRRPREGTDFVLPIVNVTPVPRDGYRIGVPAAGAYIERINSDGEASGGGNLGNNGHADSLRLNLPPLGFLLLKPSH